MLAAAQRQGITSLTDLAVRRIFLLSLPHVETASPAESPLVEQILELLHDRLLHDVCVAAQPNVPLADSEATWVVDITFRPGVLDPEGEGVSAWWADLQPRAPRITLRTGRRYLVHGSLTAAEVELLATAVLSNPLIHRASIAARPAAADGNRAAQVASPWEMAGGTSELEPPDIRHKIRESATAVAWQRAATAVATNIPARADWRLSQSVSRGAGVAERWNSAAGVGVSGVQLIALAGLDDAALVAMSRERQLALSAGEMRAIQTYYDGIGRSATDVELESFALTWSEHCCHKTLRAPIDFTEISPDGRRRTRRIDGILRETIIAATRRLRRGWVRSAFEGNAGLIAFDASYDVAVKVETHNHPSAIEPFGGANTGIGGVIRDVLAASARPIAATDVLCFGFPTGPATRLPAGVLAPERVASGVVDGIADYGNKIGVPVVAGAILFDDGYAANPLVYCGCVGLAPVQRPSSSPRPGDLVVTIGGRTGRDGVHGATFSSADLDASESATLSSVVQIGEPIVEKRVADALERLCARGLYRALTDCGAGGFCSAIGELGAETGVHVDLSAVPLKYPGLRPWEIWLSESQERMVLAVRPEDWPAVQIILREEGVEGAVVGTFSDDRWLRVSYRGASVAELPMAVLHEERPRTALQAVWKDAETPRPDRPRAAQAPLADTLLRLLAHPTIASKAEVIRRYDHEVQGATVRGPIDGDGPADAAVLAPVAGSRRGVAIACGINPWFGRVDPYGAALLAVEEALRNLTAAGGNPRRAALLDNFSWGNPNRPEVLGALVRSAEGCRDAAIGLGAPFVSGKDSLYNEYRDPAGVSHAIPGTLLITGVAIVPDVKRARGTALRHSGDLLYIVGSTTNELGGSHLSLLHARYSDDQLPDLNLPRSRRTLNALYQAIRAGLVRACHDLAEGGLGVALAEMALGGGRGLRIDLSRVPDDGALVPIEALFAETPSRFAVAVAPEHAARFEHVVAGLPAACVGVVTDAGRMVVCDGAGGVLLDLGLTDLRAAWQTALGARDYARPEFSVPVRATPAVGVANG